MKLTKLTVLCLAFSLLAFGQNVSSSIKGVLTDPSGAGIPNAECTLTNEATGATLKTTSGPDGAFTYPTVQAGTYTLAVQARGFKALETKNIVVTASENRVLGRITMQLGQLQETITVAAETASLQLASSEKSGVITSDQIQNIAIRAPDLEYGDRRLLRGRALAPPDGQPEHQSHPDVRPLREEERGPHAARAPVAGQLPEALPGLGGHQ